jgi:hypothetical protein
LQATTIESRQGNAPLRRVRLIATRRLAIENIRTRGNIVAFHKIAFNELDRTHVSNLHIIMRRILLGQMMAVKQELRNKYMYEVIFFKSLFDDGRANVKISVL